MTENTRHLEPNWKQLALRLIEIPKRYCDCPDQLAAKETGRHTDDCPWADWTDAKAETIKYA